MPSYAIGGKSVAILSDIAVNSFRFAGVGMVWPPRRKSRLSGVASFRPLPLTKVRWFWRRCNGTAAALGGIGWAMLCMRSSQGLSVVTSARGSSGCGTGDASNASRPPPPVLVRSLMKKACDRKYFPALVIAVEPAVDNQSINLYV